MKLEDIHEEWSTDSQINVLNITEESTKGSKLHAKYWQILTHERIRLRQLETSLKSLTNDKFWFLLQGEDEETRAKGWKLPPRGKITVKDEARQLVEVDAEVIELTLKVALAKEKCLLLESIIHNINGRTFAISNIIKWKIFENGG